MRRPPNFYASVREQLGNIRVSQSTISMVKSGRRNNDTVLMAIIKADHHWDEKLKNSGF